MKNPNGYGGISKLSGNRRRPWCVRVTTGYTINADTMSVKQNRHVLGYYATRKEAIQALAKYNDNPFNLEAAKVTFRQCYVQAKEDFSAARAHNYRSAFRYLEPIADLPIRTLKAAQMQKCIDSCQTTQQREIKTVCHKVFEYALRNEIVDRDPSRYLSSNTVAPKIDREIFTSEEIAFLWENSDQWSCKVALILLYSGMRTKEFRTIKPDQIDLERRMIVLKDAKNEYSVRNVPIHDRILPLLADFKAKPITFSHEGFNKALKRFSDHTAHDCRHTFTTRIRKCGADLLTTQIILGHKPETITERVYTHLSDEELLATVNLLQY